MRTLTSMKTWARPPPVKCYPSTLDWSDRDTIRVLRPFLSQKVGGRLIEMGCGDSYWMPYFAREYGYRVSGIDFSSKRLGRTQTNLDMSGIKGDLVCGDFTGSLPGRWEGLFDVVFSGGVVEHFDPPSKVLNIFSRLMKDDGLMITTTPHFKGFWGVLDSKLNRNSKSEHVGMDLGDLSGEHERAGLEVVHAEYFRWLDLGVINCSSYWRRVFYAFAVSSNLCFEAATRLLRIRRLPEPWYTNILVVAKK